MNKNLPKNYDNIIDLINFHAFIEELFIQHQLHIMNGHFKSALKILRILKKYLYQHIHDEEGLLIPLYAEKISPHPQGGNVDFYIKEHRQLLIYLDHFIKILSEQADIKKDISMERVKLFDLYYKFKHLMEHHSAREDTFLYRLLDRVVKKQEKVELLRQMIKNQNRINPGI